MFLFYTSNMTPMRYLNIIYNIFMKGNVLTNKNLTLCRIIYMELILFYIRQGIFLRLLTAILILGVYQKPRPSNQRFETD